MKAFKDDSNTTRIAVLETLAQQTHQTLLRLEGKIDRLDKKFEEKIDNLEKKIDDKIDKVENKISKLDDKLDSKIDKLDIKIDNIRKENTSHFRTTIFTLLTLIGTPLLIESIKLLTHFVIQS